MPKQNLPLALLYTSGSTLYALVHGVVSGVEKVWNPTLNTGAGGWENYNSAHWAQYAVALTEQTGSGYYSATYPANIDGVLTTEAVYVQGGGSPTLGDNPATGLLSSQGQNVTGVARESVAAENLREALVSEQKGLVAAGPTLSLIPTDLESTQLGAYAGRSVLFTSGPANQVAARITGYNPTAGILTLAAPLPVLPEEGDSFIIV